MSSPESFDRNWLPPDVPQHDAFSYELRELSQRPSSTGPSKDASTGENLSPSATAADGFAIASASDASNASSDISTATSDSEKKTEERKFNEDGWTDTTIDAVVGTATILGGYALGTYLFHNPTAGTKLFGVVPHVLEPALARGMGVGITLQAAVPARHYLYEGITGKDETWGRSADHAYAGAMYAFVAEKLTGRLLKNWL